MRSGLKLAFGMGILAVVSPGLFAATCTSWTLGNGTTTIAPGTSASGTLTGTIPCTVGSDTFSNFYVYNGATSDTDVTVGVSFSGPATMTFSASGVDSVTDFDVVFEVTPAQGSVTVTEASSAGSIIETVCSVQVLQGQSCQGNGGTVLNSPPTAGIVSGSNTVTFNLAPSPTGNDWFFEDVSRTTSFSKSFAVPEPITLPLVGIGLLGLGLIRRSVRQK